MQNPTVASHYVRALIGPLRRQGIDYKRHLFHAGISEAVLGDERARVPYRSYVKLIRRAWRILQDENLGLSKVPLKMGAFKFAGLLMIHTPTLRHALKRGVEFYNYLDVGYKIAVKEMGEDASIEVQLTDKSADPDHLFADYILSGWHRFSGWLIDKNIVLKLAEFDFPPPPHEAEYQYIFPCPRNFGGDRLRISFSKHYLDQPVVRGYEDFQKYIQQTPSGLLINPVGDDSFNTKIRRLLDSYPDCQFPSFEQVADNLHMTPKTLRQKLKNEGITYQKIKDVIRRDAAIHYLTLYRMSIAEIAIKTGFTETGAFIRAFKAWTGVTPGAYRNQDDSQS